MSAFKNTMKALKPQFPQGITPTVPSGALLFMKLHGDVAWIREGTGVPNRLSGRIGVHTQVKETAAVMPTPKKAGGTN